VDSDGKGDYVTEIQMAKLGGGALGGDFEDGESGALGVSRWALRLSRSVRENRASD
jgi:hypothetical protein